MISTLYDARRLAETSLRKLESDVPGGLSIIDNEIITKDYGWIFFYDSTRYLETRSLEDAIAGNAPLVVLRDGSVHSLGTAYPFEESLKEFEQRMFSPASEE